ncbi:MAG: hypothetical protein M1834_009403 [Cirrosporium novae-zelandiae]|nr:MAG: hypothetical protein M1834_009403 [Cirrosporium novae-zelandiae]
MSHMIAFTGIYPTSFYDHSEAAVPVYPTCFRVHQEHDLTEHHLTSDTPPISSLSLLLTSSSLARLLHPNKPQLSTTSAITLTSEIENPKRYHSRRSVFGTSYSPSIAIATVMTPDSKHPPLLPRVQELSSTSATNYQEYIERWIWT